MGRWLAVLLMLSAACGAPTTPSAASFEGHWTGSYIVRDCTPVGWPSCDSVGEPIGSIHPFDLSLTQDGSSVSGTLRVSDSTALTMPVTGVIVAGTLTLQGAVTDPIPN